MSYQVKWISENLGVTRKALRCFEEKGLMPKNENREYRRYSDEDIERIWHIRLLQGIGFSLKEISNLMQCNELNIEDALSEKITVLEKKRLDIDMHLGYAMAIKMTGRMPVRPKEMGTVTCKEFNEKAIEGWNINNDIQIVQCQEMIDNILLKPQGEIEKNDLGKILSLFENMTESKMNQIMTEYTLIRLILDKKMLGVNHKEIQMLVKFIYDNLISNEDDVKDMTKAQFARFYATSFMYGDIARIRKREMGEVECRFIADAVAVFGGYTGFDEMEEKDL